MENFSSEKNKIKIKVTNQEGQLEEKTENLVLSLTAFFFSKTFFWVVLVLVLVCVYIFGVLNFDYFSKLAEYHLFQKKYNNTKIYKLRETKQVYFTPNVLEIKRLGIKAPIIYVEETSESVFQEALQSGVVHFPGTALPGRFGNCYIFGHSSDYIFSKGDFKTVFAALPKIELGSEVEISDENGNLFKYKVISSKRVESKDLSVLDQGDGTKRLLSLQTSYPLGTALARWVVVAELVN